MQEIILKKFEQVFQYSSILSISGESGTGKTSLALFLVSKSLINEKKNNKSCFWIQASEIFPKKRLISMYKDQKEKYDYLLQNIYITPRKVITLYSEQNEVLEGMIDEKFLFPPNLKFMVIDNISHHLRFEISKIEDIRKRTFILNHFYDNILCPLILRCQRENITLIMIHEVSFNVKLQKILPFFHSLYERIKGVNIYLSKSSLSIDREMVIEVGEKIATLSFHLNDIGFCFSK